MSLLIIILWVITLVIAFVSGLLVYRNNAKKFERLEEEAKAKGKTVEDLIKEW